MIFNTSWFLAFFAIFYFFLWLVPGKKIRFYYVLVCSAIFHYHFAGPAGVAPVVVMGIAVYLIGLKLADAEEISKKKWYLCGIFVPVLGLIYYKYRVFFLTSLSGMAPGLDGYLAPFMRPSPMPLAISFFTFEFVHYLTDVFKGQAPIRSPFQFALFSIYFPSIVSGPIKRYEDFTGQIASGFDSPKESGTALEGLAQVILGFFKKMVIADNVTLMISLMELHQDWGKSQVLMLLVLLSIRILFDFSGYSDMAIGLSKMIGLRLPANFNFPYIAQNPSDFWRRWHMSLSSWVRDYIYIPLGGSRQGNLRRGLNGLLAMALCGLWHGAAWNFVLWGLYHGLGLFVHASYRIWRPLRGPASLMHQGLAMAATLAFVAYGWLLFFYPMDKVWFFTRRLMGV